MKKHLSSIVKEYGFDSVQAFSKEFNVSRREYFDYQAACAEWKKTYGDKAIMFTSIKERLGKKVQIIKERDGNSDYRVRQKDKEAR